ncbi:TPA: hypothetical protein ACGI56_000252 [Clostridioides difficile]
MKINSKISNVVWNIETKELNKHDIFFIENFNPLIYHNDIDCYMWSFDEQLPSGLWLENIRFNNKITEAKAIVL